MKKRVFGRLILFLILRFKMNTGAEVTVISEATYESLKKSITPEDIVWTICRTSTYFRNSLNGT